MLRLLNAFAGAYANAYDAYFQRVYTLAWVFAILTVIVAIVLHLSKRKKACIIWIICGTVFWFFGGYVRLAEFFVR